MSHIIDESLSEIDIASVMDDAVDLIIVMTCKGQLLYLNSSARRFLRTQKNYQQAKLVEFISHDNYQQLLTKAMPTAIEQGHWSGTIVLQNMHHQDLPVSITLMPLASDQNSDCQHFSMIARDITDHHMMETMLVQLLEKEREMNDIKNNFLELLSHEFRNPL
ncbi:MAG: PAS domain-containing protein, partial [Aggregatilineales bacterium]